MLTVKAGVQPPLIYLVAAIGKIAERLGISWELSSGLDRRHSEWSGHYQLRAVDIGTDGITDAEADQIRMEVIRLMRLQGDPGRIYVKVKDRGTDNEHVHVQFK